MCSGKEFHNFGAAQLKALPPKEGNLKFETLNKSAEDDLRELEGMYS